MASLLSDERSREASPARAREVLRPYPEYSRDNSYPWSPFPPRRARWARALLSRPLPGGCRRPGGPARNPTPWTLNQVGLCVVTFILLEPFLGDISPVTRLEHPILVHIFIIVPGLRTGGLSRPRSGGCRRPGGPATLNTEPGCRGAPACPFPRRSARRRERRRRTSRRRGACCFSDLRPTRRRRRPSRTRRTRPCRA